MSLTMDHVARAVGGLNPAAIALFFVAFHMIGDYVTQTNWMARYKMAAGWPTSTERCSDYGMLEPAQHSRLDREINAAEVRTLHVFLYTLPFVILGILTLSSSQAFWSSLSIFVPHWIIDCRRWASPDPWPPKPIMVDQALHALHLAIVFAVFYGTN